MGNYKYDKYKKVEDSTKGMSDVNPRTYKRDVLMQVWLQSRHLATLLKWLEGSGTSIRFRSEIVQITLEQVVEHLVSTGSIEMIEYAEDAQRMLERFGVNSNPSGRGGKNAFHNLTLDNRIKSGEVGSYNPESRFIKEGLDAEESLPMQSKGDERPRQALDNIDEGEVLKVMEKMEDEARRNSAKEEVKNVLANSTKGKDIGNGEYIIIPNVSPDNPRGPVGEEYMKKIEEENKKRDKAESNEREKERLRKKREKILNRKEEREVNKIYEEEE